MDCLFHSVDKVLSTLDLKGGLASFSTLRSVFFNEQSTVFSYKDFKGGHLKSLKTALSGGQCDCPSDFIRKLFVSAPSASVRKINFIDS